GRILQRLTGFEQCSNVNAIVGLNFGSHMYSPCLALGVSGQNPAGSHSYPEQIFPRHGMGTQAFLQVDLRQGIVVPPVWTSAFAGEGPDSDLGLISARDHRA